MKKPFQPSIVSANDLMIGDVIYWSSVHGWSREIALAETAHDSDHAATLLHEASADPHAVGAYLLAVDSAQGKRPTRYREYLRDLGPSNRLDLGRQASNNPQRIGHDHVPVR